MAINKFLVKILAIILRKTSSFGRVVFRKLSFFNKYWQKGFNIFFRLTIFPLYKSYYTIKTKFLNVYSPTKSRVFYILNKSYLIHVILIVFGLLITVNSIGAKDLRADNFGERTIIYKIVSKEPMEELTEETTVGTSSTQILSYLDQGSVAQKATGENSEAGQRMVTDFSTMTEGGTAVAKPNFIEPIEIEDLPEIKDLNNRNGVTSYVVQNGDTLSSIADNFNVSVNTILWQNNLGARGLIHPGDNLEILPTTGVVHKVNRGENLGSIAKKYGIETDKIVSYNNLFDVNDIKINQELIIPGGKKIIPYVSKPKYASNVPTVSPISKLFVPPSQISTGSGMLWPAGVRRISQYYSWRHKGLDIAGPSGTPIYASEAGTVTYAGWSNGYGNNILISHGNGRQTRYAHATKLYVSKGTKVTKGQTIMAMGSTGWSTGPHLHFEVIVHGVKKNPLSYIK